MTEVGSERSSQTGGQCLQLAGHNVHPRHCVIAHTEAIVTVTPCGREAETYVNGQRVYETTILQVRQTGVRCTEGYGWGARCTEGYGWGVWRGTAGVYGGVRQTRWAATLGRYGRRVCNKQSDMYDSSGMQ